MSLPAVSPVPEKVAANYKNIPYRLPSRILLILINLIVVMYIFLMLVLVKTADYQYHVEAAWAFSNGANFYFPHRLYPYMTIAIEAILPGENFTAASILTSMLAYVILAVVVASDYHRQLRGRHPWQAVALTLGLFLTGPILIFNLTSGPASQSFVYLHPFSYHNPTTTMMRPFAVIVFLYAAAAFVPPLISWGQVAVGALMTFLLGNAKPNYSLALVPGACLVMVYRFWKQQFVDYRMLLTIVGMMLLLLGLQYIATLNSGGESTGVGIQPFAFLMSLGFNIPEIIPKHILSFVMPLAVLVLYWSEARSNPSLGLAWITFLFGVFIELFLAELGIYVRDGNYYWTGEITLFVLLFASIQFWLRMMGGRLDFKDWRARIVWVVWGLHLISGVYWYFLHYTAR